MTQALSSAKALPELSVLHEQVIDFIVANPGVGKEAVAKHFGYSASWMYQLMGSDLFRARLMERQAQVSALTTVQTVGRLQNLAEAALKRLQVHMDAGGASVDETRKVAETALRGLAHGGFAPGPRGPQAVVNVAGSAQFVSVSKDVLGDARQLMLKPPGPPPLEHEAQSSEG